MSIIKERNTDLNEYIQALEMNDFYAVEQVNGKYYSIFPIGVSIIGVPFVYILDKTAELLSARLPSYKTSISHSDQINTDTHLLDLYHGVFELIIASFICALASVFIYLIANNYIPLPLSLLVTFIFSFCTSVWSTG